jgi:hypothetical protein
MSMSRLSAEFEKRDAWRKSQRKVTMMHFEWIFADSFLLE